MSKVFIEESTLTAIGDAIREKNGSSELIAPQDMDTAINSLAIMPPEELVITGDCHYKFASSSWNWYIENYKNKITTKDITDTSYMFYDNTTLTSIPFTINLSKDAYKHQYMFCGANISAVPTVLSPTKDILAGNGLFPDIRGIFKNCKAKTIPYNFISNIYGFNTENWLNFKQKEQGNRLQEMFYGCSNLRTLPDLSKLDTDCTLGGSGVSGFIYNGLFYKCHSLDEIINIPLQQPMRTNQFTNTFDNCHRVKNITFKSGQVAKWTNQTIDLKNGYIGFFPDESLAEDNFTQTTRITNSDTYNSLKNNYNSWTTLQPFSRYNHDSAVNTINSLPDTSAYIAEQGGTNTIMFNSVSGENTDGGAIHNLTAQEIAVATAKGWSIAF